MKPMINLIRRINKNMKSFKSYLSEAVKEIPLRIKIAAEVTDDMMNVIETELSRFDVVSVSKPTKTIMQEHPLDFGTKIRNTEVYIIDAVVHLPVSHETIRRNLSDKLGLVYDYVVVKGPNDPIEAENEAEVARQQANAEDYQPKMGKEYSEDEQYKDADKIAGEEHKKNFLQTLIDNKAKDPDRANVEVEGPLSVATKTDAKDSSEPRESEKGAKSPLSNDNRGKR